MKTTFYKPVLFTMLAAGMLASCINDDDYGIVNVPCTETTLQKNFEVADVPAGTVLAQFTQDKVIEAYVTSSDRSGNFFKSISFQTLNGSHGFSVPVDVSSTFINFEPGRKVYIKLQGLYTDRRNGVRIGDVYLNGSAAEVGRLPESKYRTALQRSCTVVDEDVLARPMTIAQALNDANLNTLIDLQNVQFESGALGRNYYDATDQIGGATNHDLLDATGAKIIFRTSSFADFAPRKVAEGSGTVRGVLTKFNNDYQFIARSEADVNLTGERFAIDLSAPALTGNNITFAGTYSETFESYAVANRNFPRAVNDPTEGTRYWEVKQFPANTGNKYIEMTSFNGGSNPGVPAKVLYFVPVDFTAASNFTFKKQFRFMAGAALNVYYVTAANYTAGGPVNMANFVPITGDFNNLQYPATGQSQNSFTTAGNYAIPASLTGNGFFVFEYVGTTTVTTTVQIDDIEIN